MFSTKICNTFAVTMLLTLAVGFAGSVGLIDSADLISDVSAEDWRGFRGESGGGLAVAGTKVPLTFGDSENVKWKMELPGAGASSPIIVGDKVVLTCYSGYGQSRDEIGDIENLKRHVVCYSRVDGAKLWQKDFDPVVAEDPYRGMGVPEHGYSSSTPVSDGTNVYVFFGKSGVVAMDLDGNEIWTTSVGTGSGQMKWGSGASPVLANGVVIVNATDESNAIVGLDKNTGAEVWRNEGVENVWGTPLVVNQNDDKTVVVSVPHEIWALDPETGKLDWFTTNGVNDRSVSASPVLSGDAVIAMGGRSNTGVSIRIGGKEGADVTKENTLWEGKAVTRIMTPIVSNGYVFGVSRGIITCADANTGKQIYRERVPTADNGGRRGPSGDYSSPVAVDGRIYQMSKNGTCLVFAAKPEFEMLATNQFKKDGSEFNSTPAIANNEMFIRSNKYLYCIGG